MASSVDQSLSSSSQQGDLISRSALLRADGNIFYKQASEAGFCLSISRIKIRRALELYTEALQISTGPDDSASCHKNLGLLHWLSCKLEFNQLVTQYSDEDLQHAGGSSLSRNSRGQLSMCRLLLKDSIRSLVQAQEYGSTCKPTPWLDQCSRILTSIVKWAADQSSLLPISHSPLLQYLCEALENESHPEARSSCLLAYNKHAESLFKEALTRKLPDKSMDYQGCHSLLHDCAIPLRKGIAFRASTSEQKSVQQEMQELQQSVNVHMCICEAMQAIALGDKALAEALLDDEDINMEKVKDCLDCYRQASIATRELDMETEAIAMSRIGKVYSDVLKLLEKAHKYHFQAVRLALTVMAPSIERSEWYKLSVERVRKNQGMVEAMEREEKERERAPAKERMKEKLAALSRKATYDAQSFLKYVYEEHPHPELRRNMVPPPSGSTDREVMKASLKKAILHYHPDTNIQFGLDWRVLCEEICKHLNEKYTRQFKSL